MIIRVYRREKEVIVAACDEELLGKRFMEGDLRLHVSEGFYGIERGSEEELKSALKGCTTANLVGERTISVAVDAGFIDESGVIHIGGVPHAQLYKIL